MRVVFGDSDGLQFGAATEQPVVHILNAFADASASQVWQTAEHIFVHVVDGVRYDEVFQRAWRVESAYLDACDGVFYTFYYHMVRDMVGSAPSDMPLFNPYGSVGVVKQPYKAALSVFSALWHCLITLFTQHGQCCYATLSDSDIFSAVSLISVMSKTNGWCDSQTKSHSAHIMCRLIIAAI